MSESFTIETFINLPISQLGPVKPRIQEQSYFKGPASVQVPLFKHGLVTQSSRSVKVFKWKIKKTIIKLM